jgi:hypothetical protein
MSRRVLYGTCIAVAALAVAAAIAGLRGDVQAGPPDAISKAVAYAQDAGFVQEPSRIRIARMDELSFHGIVNPEREVLAGEEASNRPVWVVELTGRVVPNLPGAGNYEYDGLTVAIDAETGALVEIVARARGYELDFGGEEVTIEDGDRFPLSGGEDWTDNMYPTSTPVVR